MLKYYITVLFRQSKKTLNQFFTFLGQKEIFKLAYLFDLSNRTNKKSSEIKVKNKTIHVYVIKQKLFGYSPSSVLLN